MKTAKKVIALVLCAALLIGASVMGTLAYLTSQQSVTNTFTVGDIKIKLHETEVDGDGKPVNPAADTYTGNAGVKIIPGRTITKDPTVEVLEGSEAAYIRMKVTISNYKELKEIFGADFLPQNYVTGWNNATWVTTGVVTEDTTNNTATYEFRYKEIYTATADDKDADEEYDILDPLFTTFTLPGDEVDNDELKKLKGLSIVVTAEAIQAETFNDADEAWAAFNP